MPDVNKVIIDNIKKSIASKGYKQKAVAHMTGYSAQELSNLLNGRKIIRAQDVIALSNVLGIDPNEIYGISRNVQ